MLLEQFGGGNAKIDYERAINFRDGSGTKDALQLLMIRKFTHVRQIQ
jgi:Mn-containing catalase